MAGVELRVVGARGWGGVQAAGWLGRVSDDELARLYRGAKCVVYASLYEGFGLPIAEAMACGTPVVTSRGGATEETAGGAAVLVDPYDPAGIAAGIADATSRRDELRMLGLERARAFSWDAAARATAERLPRGGCMSALVVIDADVLGRRRTGDETYVLNLLRHLPAAARRRIRFAALTRRPELVPEGIEAIHVRPAPRSCAWRGRCRAYCEAAPGARALPARAAAALPVPRGRHDPRPVVRTRSFGDAAARPRRLQDRRAALGEARRARARRLRADEGRPRRAVRHRRRRRSPSRRTARIPRSRRATEARRVRAVRGDLSRNARTRWRRPTLPPRSGCRSSSPAPCATRSSRASSSGAGPSCAAT